jgi:hypothetical protein
VKPLCEPPWPLAPFLGELDRRLLVLLAFGFALVLYRNRTTRDRILTPREDIGGLIKRSLGEEGWVVKLTSEGGNQVIHIWIEEEGLMENNKAGNLQDL